MTDNLDSAARQRLETFARREKQLDTLAGVHRAFIGVIESAITEARSDLNSAVMTQGALKEALAAVRMADTLANLQSDSNLLAGALSSAAAATRTKALDDAEKVFKTTRKKMTDNIEVVRELFAAPLIKEGANKLIALGEGRDGIFDLRGKELQVVDAGQSILDDTHRFNSFLAMGVKELVGDVQTSTALTSEKALSLTSFAIMVMIAMGAAAFIGSLLFVWLYVGRNILRRIGNLQSVMQRLAQGDLEAEVMASKTRDEVAEMAKSLEVFRESMLQSKTLAAEQDKDRAAKAERTERMEARIANFEDTVRSALDMLMASTSDMQTTAEAMSNSVDRSTRAGQRSGRGRRRDLRQRADGVVGHRGAVLLDRRDQPPGRLLDPGRHQGRQRSQRHRLDHAGAGRFGRPHLHRGGPDPDHRLADQPAGAERDH